MESKLLHTSTTTREFTLQFLEQITDHFSEEHIIGRGGFGVVYKGVLDNEEEIAVKKLHNIPWLDDQQFNNELRNLMMVQHQNIIRLVGFCHHKTKLPVTYNGKLIYADVEERALFLEYLQGGSLDKYLSDESCGHDWQIRYRVIKGICEGLDYLHNGSEEPIYHLDLKLENILLDKNMMPKIGDFGLSRLFASAGTYTTKNMIGTPGFMPPEYIERHKISNKFDVFSLGVIIIQVIAGREGYSKCADMSSQQFIGRVHQKWATRLKETMASPSLQEIRTCLKIALRCVEANRVKRPTTTEIVDELSKINSTAEGSHVDEDFPTELSQSDLNDLDAIRVIGRSISGIVQLVHHKETGQYFALKTIQVKTDPSVRIAIAEELKNSLLTKCKYVVLSRDAYYWHESIYLLCEYMDGGSLADFMRTVRTIPETYLAAICNKVLKGLMYLHDEMHIIHCDLKPSRILINHSGEVKISDLSSSGKMPSSSSQMDDFVGTYYYMAPERISGQSYGCVSDIWSLGLIMLRCATGKHPYPSRDSFYELLEAVVDQPPPSAPSDQFSAEFSSFVSACMQKEAKDRPSAQVLSTHPFLRMYDEQNIDLASYFTTAGLVVPFGNIDV